METGKENSTPSDSVEQSLSKAVLPILDRAGIARVVVVVVGKAAACVRRFVPPMKYSTPSRRDFVDERRQMGETVHAAPTAARDVLILGINTGKNRKGPK